MDYERHQNKYDSYAKKVKRSDRDNVSMAKAETDLANAKDIYTTADNTLRERLPLAGATLTEFAPSSPAAAVDDLGTILRVIGALA